MFSSLPGPDAEQRTYPVLGQKNAGMNVQLSRGRVDVVFDGARRNSCVSANFGVTEALGEQIENFDFPRRHVNRTRPWPCRHVGSSSGIVGGLTLGGLFLSSRALPIINWRDYNADGIKARACCLVPLVVSLWQQIEERPLRVARDRLVREQFQLQACLRISAALSPCRRSAARWISSSPSLLPRLVLMGSSWNLGATASWLWELHPAIVNLHP